MDFLNPISFSSLKVERDSSGRYVEIDDMRFRVDPYRRFGRVGKPWPNGQLIYEFAPDVASNQSRVDQFHRACELLLARTAIACVDRQSSSAVAPDDYVYVVASLGNHSYVGRAEGRQELGIANWNKEFVIAHELKHALGWTHEHQRKDRDEYIEHKSRNAIPGTSENFRIEPGISTNTPYDWDSVMHYPPKAFTNGLGKTLVPLPRHSSKEPLMGQRDHISRIDEQEIIEVYGPKGTRWCGVRREPAGAPPSGCSLRCDRTSKGRSGRWRMCGTCEGAKACP